MAEVMQCKPKFQWRSWTIDVSIEAINRWASKSDDEETETKTKSRLVAGDINIYQPDKKLMSRWVRVPIVMIQSPRYATVKHIYLEEECQNDMRSHEYRGNNFKKSTASDDVDMDSRRQEQAGGPGSIYEDAIVDLGGEYVFYVPVPEKTQVQHNDVLFPRGTCLPSKTNPPNRRATGPGTHNDLIAELEQRFNTGQSDLNEDLATGNGNHWIPTSKSSFTSSAEDIL
ncbi:hypothetical protein NM208_g10872 [Fusarium decemcellulare]|uniref:Uncharacterized protein n=1 Tax=Fusarium decemcellulare TaxID=57161 RepID=A0ACC1RWB0_9HYPO|nr:hypothetical protein NM208_g10872 [Fusarium decemcellulare]